MDVVLSNPAAWWALLGIPAVLAIHLLQRKSRRVVASTLFLLEQVVPASAHGRRLERLRQSIPLWLQLLAVLILAWLLLQPRWLRSDSAQTVAVVLDSSVSMKAWRQPVLAALEARLRALEGGAARTEWVVTESDLARATIYSGGDLDALLSSLAAWNPTAGTHDPSPALRVAQSLVRSNGVALFVTDHHQPLPEGVRSLAGALPLDNVGFIGLGVDGSRWTALVRNHGTTPQAREWRVEAGGLPSEARSLTLEPGRTETLGGVLPPGVDRIEVVLGPDLFTTDDRLPIIRPVPKPLDVAIQPDTPLDAFFRHFAASLPNANSSASHDGADLRLLRYDPLAPSAVPPRSIVALADATPARAWLDGLVVAEEHPLTADLNWQGLLCRDTLPIPAKEGDAVLLWHGRRPLISLRGGAGEQSLVVNFDVRQSNADRLPAFVVLLNRFAESIRAGKIAYESRNAGTNESLEVASRADAAVPVLEPGDGGSGPLRAPGAPGFFSVTQGGVRLVDGAAHFADPREADFRAAATFDTAADVPRAQAERNSREDFLTPVWALLLGAVLLANWHFLGRGRE